MEPVFNPESASIVAALGNPESEYAGTYHNVAREAFDAWGISGFKTPKGKHFSYAPWGMHTAIRPETYMNESGRAIAEALSYFKQSPRALVVIHDDADLEPGTWKFEFGRGDAGHNGVKSIIAALGTKDFWRVRIGTGQTRPGGIRKSAGDFALAPVSRGDAEKFKAVFAEIETALTATAA